MRLASFIAIASIAVSATFASAAISTTEAFDNATVQPAGPRTGTSGKNFFNVEGNDFGTFASFGVTDFTITKSSFGFGPSDVVADISSIELQLTQSNAAFSVAGPVRIFLAENTSASIQPGGGLAFNSSSLPYGVGSQLGNLTDLGTLQFTNVANGTVDSALLNLNSAAETALINAINAGSVVRLVIAPETNGVTATYAGFSNATLAGPTLVVTAAVPEPTAMSLLGLAALPLLKRRR